MFQITPDELKRRLEHPENIAAGSAPVSETGESSTKDAVGDVLETEVGPGSAGEEGGGASITSTPLDFASIEGFIDEVVSSSKPRKPHVRLSEEQKVVAGTLAHLQPQSSVAELFGPTQPAISMMARGLDGGTSLAQQRPNPSRREEIKSRVEEILDLSRDVVLRSLTKITDNKLDSLKATELAKVAGSVAGVVDKISAKSASNQGSQVVVVAFQPKRIDEYNAIDVPAVVER